MESRQEIPAEDLVPELYDQLLALAERHFARPPADHTLQPTAVVNEAYLKLAAAGVFGELLHFHPHLHALVTDGVFTPDGSFIALPALDDEPFEKLWQRKVFDLLLKRGKISESLVTQMLG